MPGRAFPSVVIQDSFKHLEGTAQHVTNMRYEEVVPIAREDAETAFGSDDARAISSALVSLAFYDTDWRWVEGVCLRFARHPNPALRAIAVTCLGHLARIHRVLDMEIVKPVLQDLLSDEKVRGYAEDALSEIRVSLPTTRRELDEALSSEDPDEIVDALERMVHHESDGQWVLSQCLKFSKHNIRKVKQAAVACLGHLPLYYSFEDYGPILAALNALLGDPEVAEQAEEAIDLVSLVAAEN